MVIKHTQQSGIALLITILVIGVVVAIGLSILELTQKQVRLSSNSADSEAAFHATNAGTECARYWRRVKSDEFEQVPPNSGNVTNNECFGDTQTFTDVGLGAMSVDSGVGNAYRYTAEFDWDSSDDRCTSIDMLVMVVSPTAADPFVLEDVNLVYPGYTGDFADSSGNTKTCDPGGRCTLMAVQGYNKACSAIDTIGTVQREVLLQF